MDYLEPISINEKSRQTYICLTRIVYNFQIGQYQLACQTLVFSGSLVFSKSNDRDDILIPGKALGVDDVEDAGSVELTVSHEDFL